MASQQQWFNFLFHTGEVRRARRGGHIPGAVNTPYRAFLAERASPDGETFRVFKDLQGIKEVRVHGLPCVRACVRACVRLDLCFPICVFRGVASAGDVSAACNCRGVGGIGGGEGGS